MDVTGDEIAVENNEGARRYEARVQGLLSVLEYRRSGDQIVFTHTGVPDELEGQGIAAKMTRVALDEARARHLMVVPRCPFVAAYIRRHPEYQDLVLPEQREQPHND